MSHTLVFKKDGVEILSLGVGHPMAVAFLDKPYGEFQAMPRTAFADARHTLILQDESLADDYETAEKILTYTSKDDVIWDSVIRMRNIKTERKSIADAKVMVDMLEMIWEEGEYIDNESKVVKNIGLEWGVV